MSWGVYPRLARARGLRAPPNPVCMDAAAYSLTDARGEESAFVARLYGDIALGVRMYLRPRQTMTVTAFHEAA